MDNSKLIKGLPREVSLNYQEKPETFLSKIKQVTVTTFKWYVYYPIDNFFSRIYERTSRSLAFAKHGWMHYDFESAYLYDIMAFKMKRIYKCLENGNAIQEDEDMKALKEAITICERLFEGKYEEKYRKEHDKKWGKIKSKHIPEYYENGKIKYYRWEMSRPNAKTAAQKKKEVEDFRQIYVNSEIDRKLDIDRLAEILKNHEQKWWD